MKESLNNEVTEPETMPAHIGLSFSEADVTVGSAITMREIRSTPSGNGTYLWPRINYTKLPTEFGEPDQ